MDIYEFNRWMEEVRNHGMKPGLIRVKSLLNRMDNPQNKLQIIHITGTNGKGSTATLLNAILIASGYKTGQFSTPSILGFNQMFLIDHQPIGNDKLCDIATRIKLVIQQMLEDGEEHPTEYEIIAAMMYIHFYEAHVDFAVVEVAMGGENDCTNVMDHSILSMITPISLDHNQFLGDTLEAIALEKSGVIKANSVLITHPQDAKVMAVLEQVCDEKMSVLRSFEPETEVRLNGFEQIFTYKGLEIKSKLLGNHQMNNIIGVIEAVHNLNNRGYTYIETKALLDAIYNTTFEGRFERIQNWILDGAHNNESLIALSETLSLTNTNACIGVLAILGDKAIEKGLLALKPYIKSLILTEPKNPRKLEILKLQSKVEAMGFEVIYMSENYDQVVAYANQQQGVKLAFGSFYMLEHLRKKLVE